MKRAAQAAFDSAVGILAVLAVGLAILWIRGIQPLIVISGSMEPEIRVGSVCLADTGVSFGEIRIGDVIVYRLNDDTLVTHRVIDKTEEGLETKGDANDVSDGIAATPENLYGRVVATILYLGYCIMFLKIPAVRITAGAGLSLLYLLTMITEETETKKPREDKI